jgi:tetratricopeptide (TPR) repeat protein
MQVKRSSRLLGGAVIVAAALSVGCASSAEKQKKADDKAMANSAEKYHLLNGSTAGNDAKAQDAEVAPEPELSADTRFAAGLLAESEGKTDCAIIQYDQAIRLNGNHVPSLYRMGVCQTKSKNYEKATAAWRQYIKATGDVASGWANLGFCYEMAGDVANAEKSYQEGINRDANSPPCRVNYGLMLARQNRTTEAEVQLSSVLKPDEVNYNLAAVYEQQGAIAQAKEALKKALEANPKNADAQAKLATLPQD